MKIVCAWCGKDMGEKDGRGVEGTSHGICEECQKNHFPGMTVPEPYALQVRAKLRMQSTSKLLETYKALQRGEMTGIDMLEQDRGHAISIVLEILWERGRPPEWNGESPLRGTP